MSRTTSRPTSTSSISSASSWCPASRSAASPSCNARSASPDIRWKAYSMPRAFSTTSNAAEILPTASTVASSVAAGR